MKIIKAIGIASAMISCLIIGQTLKEHLFPSKYNVTKKDTVAPAAFVLNIPISDYGGSNDGRTDNLPAFNKIKAFSKQVAAIKKNIIIAIIFDTGYYYQSDYYEFDWQSTLKLKFNCVKGRCQLSLKKKPRVDTSLFLIGKRADKFWKKGHKRKRRSLGGVYEGMLLDAPPIEDFRMLVPHKIDTTGMQHRIDSLLHGIDSMATQFWKIDSTKRFKIDTLHA